MKPGYFYVGFILPLLLWVGGKKVQISGSIYAYDPVMHLVRHTHAENVDVVILKTSQSHHNKYVKVVIQSFGQTLPESSFRDGRTIHLSTVRDKKCDEAIPAFLAKGSAPTESGHYIFSLAYEKQVRADISTLPCYVAQIKSPKELP